MNRKDVASLGGKARAPIQRENAVKAYYENPKICKNCNKIINVKENEPPGVTRRKKFCSASCAAFFNNKKRYQSDVLLCKCGDVIPRVCIGEFTRKSRRKYCEKCFILLRSNIKISEKTKGELFSSRKNWQSARTAIRKDAADVFVKSGKLYQCEKCGYTLHIEVCHKKSVSSFSNDTKIKEINNIENLVGFCETHHWEFDHGYLFFDNNGVLQSTLVENL